MNTTKFRFFLPALLTLCAIAQQESPKPATAVRPAPPIVSMAFAGGTIDDLVATLRAIEPKVNIVVAASAGSVRLPPITVKGAGLDQVLDTACAVAESSDRVQCQEQRGVGEPVFAIVARPAQSQPGSAAAAMPDTIVLSLNRLLEGIPQAGVAGLKAETILSAIDAAASFEAKQPIMRFHADSGLLFVRGAPAQLRLATEVLTSLERDLKDRMARAGRGDAGNEKADAGKDRR